jgi:type II secretory pathway pseudopilin PulG
VTIDPEVAAILAALVAAALLGAPRFRRSLRQRRRALRQCLECGRSIVFGERTCDCKVPE